MTLDRLRKREETHYKAHILGASEADIERFERVAQRFGPRTSLLNSDLYDAAWLVGLHSLAQGRSLIPLNAEHWAGEIWVQLCSLMIISAWDVGPMVEIRHAAMALWSETQ